MKTIACPLGLLLAFGVWAAPAVAQNGTKSLTLEAVAGRLEQLERQNAELLGQVAALRRELESLRPTAPAAAPEAASSVNPRLDTLEEKVQVQADHLTEQSQVKVESSQRLPVRLTGMALFNLFANGAHGGIRSYPLLASATSGQRNAGATLRQSVIGLEFQSPHGVMGGKFRGSFYMDLFDQNAGLGNESVLNQPVRLRTASIEGQWKTRGFLVGQEKPIFSPREPNSLAQVGFSPLSGAGNLWAWRPQAVFEQRVGLGAAQGLKLHIGVSQTSEAYPRVQQQFLPVLERKRPALEGRFQFTRWHDEFRRIEIAPGFHWSTTHVAGTSIPASLVSVDWFWNPVRRVEFTGMLFVGKNLAKLGAGGAGQGFTIRTPRRGEIIAIPVRSRGGWAQLTFLATSRLSFNLFGGEDDPNNRDLLPDGTARNMMQAANVHYRLAPNVIVGLEASRLRTRFLAGQNPINNHFDLSLAYLF